MISQQLRPVAGCLVEASADRSAEVRPLGHRQTLAASPPKRETPSGTRGWGGVSCFGFPERCWGHPCCQRTGAPDWSRWSGRWAAGTAGGTCWAGFDEGGRALGAERQGASPGLSVSIGTWMWCLTSAETLRLIRDGQVSFYNKVLFKTSACSTQSGSTAPCPILHPPLHTMYTLQYKWHLLYTTLLWDKICLSIVIQLTTPPPSPHTHTVHFLIQAALFFVTCSFERKFCSAKGDLTTLISLWHTSQYGGTLL